MERQISDEPVKQTKAPSIRSSTRWYEQGERSNAYFYKTIKNRSQAVSISSLRNQRSGQILTQTEDILQCAKDFSTNIYSTLTQLTNNQYKSYLMQLRMVLSSQPMVVTVRLTYQLL